jgi:SAM-dependent methyltransferase
MCIVSLSTLDVERFMAAQRDEWNEQAAAWQVWDPQFEALWNPLTQLLLNALDPQPGMQILDVASGTGQPALTLATLVSPTGSVTGVDLAEAMVAAANENARRRGFANATFHEAAAEMLPFEDASFDAVSCRCGVIYFADVGQGLQEMRRVLKPGGRAVITAWGPPDRSSTGKVNALLSRYLPPPPPPEPGTPSPYRFAEAGTLKAALEEAGFGDVQEEMHVYATSWPGRAEERWRAYVDVFPGLRHRIRAISEEQRVKLDQEVTAVIREDEDPERGQINLSAAAVLAVARRE